MAKTKQPADNMLTIQQAADLVGLSYQSVARYVAMQKIPARKFGYQWIVMERDILEFAKQPRPMGNPEFGPGFHQRRTRRKNSN